MFTWRLKFIEHPEFQKAREQGDAIVIGHWHGDELAEIPVIHRYGICTMTSLSKDGHIMDFVVRHIGGATSRGSSTRGGVTALKGLIRIIRSEGRPASLAVDGPKGPIYKVKPGIFEVAKLTSGRITPVGAACKSAYHFEKSWNKTYLPKPFTTVVLVIGQPWPSFEKNQNAKSIEYAEKLAADINAARQQALDLITPI